MIDLLKKNIEKELEILREISIFSKRMQVASPVEKDFMVESMSALRNRMVETNNLTISILNKISISEKTEEIKPQGEFRQKEAKKEVIERPMAPLMDRAKILKELSITEKVLKKIKRRKVVEKKEDEGFKETRGYLRLSNKYFLNSSSNLVKKEYFNALPIELKKSNLNVLFETYVSMMLFSTMLSIFASIFIAVFFLFFDISLSWPLIALYNGNISTRILQVIWIPFVLPIVVFMTLYFYPSIESRAIANRINEEIPFAVIHMNSISGSGIEPTSIFKIIATSKEYPFLRNEIRKVLNQTNVYGYDFVTALNNVSRSTSSSKLSELFAGLATTINSGGSLSVFFEKRAETLLLEYRLDKEKAIKIAETAMDIYISVVIAAPMILMLMLVMISVSGIQIGFTPYELTFMTIGGVALINIIFLAYLQTRKNLY